MCVSGVLPALACLQAWAVYGNWQRHTNDNSNSYRLFRDTEASVILSSCGRYEDQFKAVLDAGVTQTSPGTFVIFPNGAIGAVPLCNKLALLTDLFADGAVMECNPTRDDTEWFQARPQTVGGWEKDQLAFYPGQRLSALTSILTRFPRGSDYIRRTLSRMPIPLLQVSVRMLANSPYDGTPLVCPFDLSASCRLATPWP